MSSISSFLSENLVLVIIFLVLLIFIFFLGIPILLKIKNLYKKNKETASLKKDLMIWSRLSNLAKGGKDSDKSINEIIKSNITLINESFKKGLTFIKENGFSKNNMPWYIMVGEPFSGKSSLMNCQDLNMIPSEFEYKDSEESQSLPIRFWVNNQATVIDVSGKEFFNRWYGGYSIEWLEILKLIKKARKKQALSGIILTIPVDALLIDNEELLNKKTNIIAVELQKLISQLSIYLPCYVVITKMDILPGFSDFFSNISNLNHQIFGWDNPKTIYGYEKSIFDTFWQNTVNTLRSARNKLLLNNISILNKNVNKDNISNSIYLFPEAFNDLYSNLDKYLKIIFGMKRMHGLDNLLLKGVYFTSSFDEGIVFNKGYAEITGTEIEDAYLNKNTTNKYSRFVTDLLVHKILPNSYDSGFTGKMLFIKNLPYLVTSSVFLIFAFLWVFKSFVYSVDKSSLIPMSEVSYYNEISEVFKNKSIYNSPLFYNDEEGNPITTFNEYMANSSGLRRIEFYNFAYSNMRKHLKAPIGFKLSSLILFNSVDIAYDERQYLYDRIQTEMAYLPLLRVLENKFISSENEPMTDIKREALTEMLGIAIFNKRVENKFFSYNVGYKKSTMDSFVKYLFPDILPEIKSVIETYNPKYDRDVLYINDEIILSENYKKSIEVAIKSIINGWINLKNYPDSTYSHGRTLLTQGASLEDLYKIYLSYELVSDDNQTYELLNKEVNLWQNFNKMQLESSNKIGESIKYILAENPLAFKNLQLFMETAYHIYRNKMEKDFDLLEKYNNHILSNYSNTNIVRIDMDYLSRIKNQVSLNLKNEYDNIKNNQNLKNNSFLFTKVEENTKEENKSFLNTVENLKKIPLMNYEVISNIINLSVLPIVSINISSLLEYNSLWNENEKNYNDKLSQFNEFYDKYKKDEIINSIYPLSKKMLERQRELNQIYIINKTLELFPTSSFKLLSNISNLSNPKLMDGIFVAKGSENKGNMYEYRKEYNPDAINYYIKPFGLIHYNLKKDNTEDKMSFPYMFFSKDSRYSMIARLMNSYSSDFISYWGNYGDTLKPYFSDYNSFHKFVSNSKSFTINNYIYTAYETSQFVLNDIEDKYLPVNVATNKNSLLNLIEARKKVLDVKFSDDCSILLNNWASLSPVARQAYNEVRAMSNKDVNSKLLSITGGADGMQSIPWWNGLISQGVDLLKLSIKYDAAETIIKYKSRFNKFPILADGETTNYITEEEISSLTEILHSFGWGIINDENDDKNNENNQQIVKIKEPVSLTGIINNAEKIKEWGSKTISILNALSNIPKSLEWNVIIPDAEIQHKLSKKYVGAIPAVARFRYADISYQGVKPNTRFLTAASKGNNIEAFTDNVYINDLKINFYIHSNTLTPDASTTIHGGWSPIKLYLSEDTVEDKEKGIFYSPIIVKDNMGVEYVFFIGLKFSKKLPDKKDWPKSDNWPDFSFMNINNKRKEEVISLTKEPIYSKSSIFSLSH